MIVKALYNVINIIICPDLWNKFLVGLLLLFKFIFFNFFVGFLCFTTVFFLNREACHVIFQTQIEMSSTDLVAELRAEVTNWWEQLQKQQIQAGQQREASGLGILTFISLAGET